jgi:hypothetical protein
MDFDSSLPDMRGQIRRRIMKVKVILEAELDIDSDELEDVDVEDAVGDMEVYEELCDRARTITTKCVSAVVMNDHISGECVNCKEEKDLLPLDDDQGICDDCAQVMNDLAP